MELVVGASEATMNSLLTKLGGLLAQEYALIRGVRGDIQYITDELASVQAFLGDLSSSPEEHNRRLKNWMKQIRDMAYDMEDCIDDFAHRLPQDSLSDATCSFIVTRVYELWTFWPRREIASKIAELKVRAQHIAERRGRYGVDNPGEKNAAGATHHALTSGIAEHLIEKRQLVHALNPVGVEDMKELQKWMGKEDKHSDRAVLSIVGFGGVGKTTIATKLYQDFGKEFDCRASITVSQNFDEEQVLRDILGQIKPREIEQEQQDRNTAGRPAEKNLTAGTKGVVKRLVSLRSSRMEKGNDGSTEQQANNNIELITQVKQRHSKQEQQEDRNAGTPAEKNLDAGIKPDLAKWLVPLFRGHSKQGKDGGTQGRRAR